jgi:biotin carboxyl carrier protein
MTDNAAVKRVTAAAAALVPPLTERLARHGLGEIEIERGDVRIRVAAVPATAAAVAASRPVGTATANRPPQETRRPDGSVVRSPAVGCFVAHDGLAVGQAIVAGANVGRVDMLGVRHGTG